MDKFAMIIFVMDLNIFAVKGGQKRYTNQNIRDIAWIGAKIGNQIVESQQQMLIVNILDIKNHQYLK